MRKVSFLSTLVLVVLLLGAGPGATAVGLAPSSEDRLTFLVSSAGSQGSVQISGDTVVWVQEEPSAELGTSDRVWVKSLSTGKAFAISNASGTQTSPDVSGDVVVWGDTRNSCPTCERDIYGYRFSTGQEFSIVVGPNDQASPSISGSVVVWEEADNQTRAIHGLDLASGQALEIIAAPVDGRSSYGPPAIDRNIVVYPEVIGSPKDATHYSHVIYAYNLETGARTKVAEVHWPISYYAVSGNRVAWAAGMVHVFDLSTGQDTEMPSQPYSSMVDIEGDMVVWSDSLPGESRNRLAGYDLARGVAFLVSDALGDQLMPRLSDATIVWVSNSKGVSNIAMRKLSADLPRLMPPARSLEPSPALDERLAGAAAIQPLATFTQLKGIHTTVRTWNYGKPTSGVDALGAPGSPYFAFLVVLQNDLDTSTNRGSPWGSRVGDAMQGMYTNNGARMMVRTEPTLAPNSSGTVNPSNVGQRYADLANLEVARGWSWITMVQTENEPNLEWPRPCTNCRWSYGGQTRTYSWVDSVWDPHLYDAINQWYIDVYNDITTRRNCSPSTYCTRLRAMVRWTPALGTLYGPLSDGTNMYAHMQNMISTYGYKFTYHVYPAPNWDSLNGYVSNNTWNKDFNDWVKVRINSGAISSRITEMGWNPDQMINDQSRCPDPNKPDHHHTQNDAWFVPASCGDGRTHYFETDMSGFRNSVERHLAQGIAVWVVYWDQSSDATGLDASGNPLRWLSNYRNQ
ncbi:MAG TPA: hypothetical protein VJG32_05355 [Anaerolineae bacterium]|nr:hypothetical protein [Anaerolineae bacterium]